MARSCPYRREITDACNWHQQQALNSTIYILYQTGPTGFLLNEEGETKKFKVFLGDIHNCTCSVFRKEKDLCKHICWVILKKFRVDRNDPLSWQLGLNEREINQVIRGNAAQEQKTRAKTGSKSASKQNENVNSNETDVQRPISESDICPICQDELLAKKLPVSFCRTCGNNVHIKCMKVWADHQKSNGETELKCPLCREIFCTFDLLDQEYRNNSLFKLEKEDLHYGLTCNSCHATPINGKCYKCTSCNELYLCQACFNTDFHNQHSFVFREKINQKYRRALRDHVGMLPQAVVHSLERRDINEGDYDLLLQLNQAQASNNSNSLSQIPEKVIKSWKSERVRQNSQLLNPGVQCRICLRAYQMNQMVRKLPGCKHKFHLDCIDNWLLHSHPTCPIDGLVVWDPITAQMDKEELKVSKKSKSQTPNTDSNKQPKNNIQDLSMGLIINYKANVVENNKSNETNKTDTLFSNKILPSKVKINHRSLSTDKSKKEINRNNTFKIEIEGKNLNNNQPQSESLEEFTNNHVMNNFPTRPNTELVTVNRTLLPRIKVKGATLNNLNTENQSQFLGISATPIKETILSNNEISHFKKNHNIFNDILNVSPLINSKPYQLTRIENVISNKQSTSLTSIIRNQNDFYDDDDLESELETIKVDDYETSLRSDISRNEQVAIRNNVLSTDLLETSQKKPPSLHNNYVRNRIKLKKLSRTNSMNNIPAMINPNELSLPLVTFGVKNIAQKSENPNLEN